MIVEGLRLLALGMSMVIIFLVLLVLLISFMAWFFRRFAHYFPEQQEVATAPGIPAGAAPTGLDQSTRLAIVVAAITAHRNRQRRGE